MSVNLLKYNILQKLDEIVLNYICWNFTKYPGGLVKNHVLR